MARGGRGRSAEDLVPGFEPETGLEAALAGEPELLAGLAWGKPRPGHPEGSVGNHVGDLLAQIERWGELGARRAELRLLALVHDSLKHREIDWLPHAGPNHHGRRARRLVRRHISDERLLATIELHDRPYALWRSRNAPAGLAGRALDRTLRRIPDAELFVRFVELDASTEGKDPRPVEWLRSELRGRSASAR